MILYNIFDYQEKIYDYKYDESFDYLKLILFNEKTHLILSRVEYAIKSCINIAFENIE